MEIIAEIEQTCEKSLVDFAATGLRFFTVYGPWGGPDMALFLFADAMLKDEPINVFNHGKMIRDFTYVDDIVESITRLIPKSPRSKGLELEAKEGENKRQTPNAKPNTETNEQTPNIKLKTSNLKRTSPGLQHRQLRQEELHGHSSG